MRKIIFALCGVLFSLAGMAQSSLLATLSHSGTISTFYGTTAFKDALEKAENGDVITLSSGQFKSVNITKAITLRGAGMNIRNDSISSHEATILNGDIEINISENTADRLVVEGIYFASALKYKGTLRNALFMKSRFYEITCAEEGSMVNATFIHCRVAHYVTMYKNSNACFVNSIVWNPDNAAYEGSGFEFDNCVICFYDTGSGGKTLYCGAVTSSYYRNCVIIVNYSWVGSYYKEYCIPASCIALNCIGCSKYRLVNESNNNIFYNLKSNSTNTKIASPEVAFKTANFEYLDNETYELTDEAKQQYLGTDGKQVGIYGGNLPYEEDPTTPQITKCNVAAKSTADGKLSVDIEVKAAEY